MYLYQKGHSPITSHITIFGKNECDCISISKSDYIYEYEIKISRADFKKDFTKIKHTNIINENYTKVRKGETFYLLPNYFNFVTPRDLIKLEEVPDYAGLIFMDEDDWDMYDQIAFIIGMEKYYEVDISDQIAGGFTLGNVIPRLKRDNALNNLGI